MQESPVHAVKEIPTYAGMTVFRTTLNIQSIKGKAKYYQIKQFISLIEKNNLNIENEK